jgi:hypothetical protein
MVSARVSEIDGWGNLVCSLVGILGISPSSGEGLGMPFFFSSTVAHRAAPTRLSLYPSLVFSRSIQWDDPLQCGCRMRKIMRHRIGLAVVVWLLAIGWTTSSWALTAVPRTFAELVGLADWVLIGTVTQVTSAVEVKGTRIYTKLSAPYLLPAGLAGGWRSAEAGGGPGGIDSAGGAFPTVLWQNSV